MALNIALTPKYDPYKYEDYVKPLVEYWKDYEEQENALSEIGTTLSALDYIVDAEPENSPLKSTYANYKQQLENATAALSNGLSSADRNLLRDLKSTFAKDINPIATNYKKLQDMIVEQRKARQANNSIRFSRDASTISVGELIQNPNLSFNSYVGDQITADAINMLTPLSKVINGISKKQMLPGYTSILENYGLTVADVQSYLSNPDAPNTKFKSVIDHALKIAVTNSGVFDWGDSRAISDAYTFAKQGIYSAIGGQKTQHIKNPTDPNDSNSKNNGDGGLASIRNNKGAVLVNPKLKETKEDLQYLNSLIRDPQTGNLISPQELALQGQVENMGISWKDLPKDKSYAEYEQERRIAAHKQYDDQPWYTKIIGPTNMSDFERILSLKNTEVDDKYPDYNKIRQSGQGNIFSEYEEARKKREEFVSRYAKPGSLIDNPSGFDGGTFEEDTRKNLKLVEKQYAQSDILSNPMWDDTTNDQIVDSYMQDLQGMIASNQSKKGGKGLYEIEVSSGKEGLSDVKETYIDPDKALELFTKANTPKTVTYSSTLGPLLTIGGKFYKLKGSSMNDRHMLAIDTKNTLQGFSIPEKTSYINSAGEIMDVGIYSPDRLTDIGKQELIKVLS